MKTFFIFPPLWGKIRGGGEMKYFESGKKILCKYTIKIMIPTLIRHDCNILQIFIKNNDFHDDQAYLMSIPVAVL